VNGEIIMDVHTDFPERLTAGKIVFTGDSHRPVKLAGVRAHAGGFLVKLSGVDTPEQAGLYRNTWVFVKTSDVPVLPQGQVYQHQLLGLDVVDDRGAPLGRLTEILETGANDVYVVKNADGREVLLPAIPSVILDLDLDRRSMRVHLIEGLVPDEPAGDVE
jgi:16S rRNA processing protein RimM